MQSLALLSWTGEQLSLEFDDTGKRLSPAEHEPAKQEPFVAGASPMRQTMFGAGGEERPIDEVRGLQRTVCKGG